VTSQFVKIVNGQPVIDIGSMRHPIMIQQQTISGAYDASGVAQSAWTTVGTCNDACIGTSGVNRPNDVIRGGQTASQLFVEVVFYYADCPTLTPNMRVVTVAGSTYLIQVVENVLEMNFIWILHCIALGPNT
jgi:hypothetical protein